MSTYLKDIFSIPEHSNASDFVLRLTSNVGDEAVGALNNYVVTPNLVDAFDAALGLVSSAVSDNNSRAAFLTGSFGSGKSHFMAVLHAMCTRHPGLEALPELAPVMSKHGAALQGKKVLPLTFHMLDRDSIEQGLFDGYVSTMERLHPGAPLPALHRTDHLVENAETLRHQMGDETFLSKLNASTSQGAASSGWGSIASGTTTWTLDTYLSGIKAPGGSTERQAVVTALVSAYFNAATHLQDYVSLEDGLEAIAGHASDLGYDTAVLFIDELVLWLMYLVHDREKFTREAQKITKLVESGTGTRAIPLVSFIARQVDLRTYFADTGASGNDRKIVEDSFQHQEGRFAHIPLSNDNLVDVAHKRLLTPQNDAASNTLKQSFDRLDGSPDLWKTLLDGVNTDEHNRSSDKGKFRKTYPFSPALISTLRALAAVMQRDRTALKVMQNILVDHRDTLTIDHVIPVGDAFDYLLTGDSANNPRAATQFTAAKELYATKFRPTILQRHNVPTQTPDSELQPPVLNDLRLAKTLVLSAVASSVPALKGLTAARLAHLNHGAVFAPIPGGETGTVLTKVKQWAINIPELRIQEGAANPTISVELAEVDYTSVLDRARGHDSQPRRQNLLNEMVAEQLGIDLSTRCLGEGCPTTVVWRGTRRDVDVVFGNVRDPQEISDPDFHARPGTWRVVIDHPLDDHGRTRREDHSRLDKLPVTSNTIAWLPLHLSASRADDVGRLVVLNHLLNGGDGHWRSFSDHLPPDKAAEARSFLESNRDSLRRHINNTLEECYGIRDPQAENTITDDSGSIVRSLTPQADVKTPHGATISDGFNNLLTQALDRQYPSHPRFEPADQELKNAELKAVAEHMLAAAQSEGRRADIAMSSGRLHAIVGALGAGHASGVHYALTPDTFTPWASQLEQAAGSHPSGTPLTVRDVREWIGRIDKGQGLPERVSDLLIIGWAALTQRAWQHHGTPIDTPMPGDIKDSMSLVTQNLPTDDEWKHIRLKMSMLLGEQPSQSVPTPSGVEAASKTLDAWLRSALDDLRDFETQLKAASATWAQTDPTNDLLLGSVREREVNEARRIVDELSSGSSALMLLSSVDLGDVEDAVAATLKSAAESAEALRSFGWANFATLPVNNGGVDESESIRDELHTVLRASVFHGSGLSASLNAVEQRVEHWMRAQVSKRAAVVPETTSHTMPAIGQVDGQALSAPVDKRPAREQGNYRATSRQVVEQVHEDLLAALAAHPGRTITITWELDE